MIENITYADTSDIKVSRRSFTYEASPYKSGFNNQAEELTIRAALGDLAADVGRPAQWSAKYLLGFMGGGFKEHFWHPSGIVTGLMNQSLDRRSEVNRIELISTATAFALRAYAHGINKTHLDEITNTLDEQNLLDAKLGRAIDPVSMMSIMPGSIKKATRRLQEKTERGDLFMVPICNGGLVHGLATAMHYKKMTPQAAETRIYPIHYSRAKSRNVAPQISTAEEDYILAGSEGRTLVVVDDDACSGLTIDGLVSHLKEKGAEQVVGMAIKDLRSSRSHPDLDLGEWWEKG